MSLIEDFAKAIEDGDPNQVEKLLASGSIDVNARLPRKHNPPPLVYAARCDARRVDIVEMLLRAGAHIDGVDDNGQTACFAAAWASSVELVAALLKHRPNLELVDNVYNQSALQLSLDFSDFANDCVSVMLINAGASLALCAELRCLCSVASRSTSAIQALLNRGVNVNRLRNLEMRTPLHLVACSTRPDAAVLSLLINGRDVDLEVRDSFGQTCTFIAAGSGNHRELRCFIDAGADVNGVDDTGQTPLHNVASYECAILLLAAGADLNARDDEGRKTFYWAFLWTQTAVLPAFLAAGAKPDDMYLISAPDAAQVETARRDIAKTRLDFVRHRALQVCIGLQSLGLDALQMCEIMQHSCGPVAHVIAIHQWWKIATIVKHFHDHDS
jgi:ankyrin repeat protein